jgi:hypothetical protein
MTDRRAEMISRLPRFPFGSLKPVYREPERESPRPYSPLNDRLQATLDAAFMRATAILPR